MDVDQMNIVLKKISETEAGQIVSGLDCIQASGKYGDILQTKADKLYNFIAPKLNLELFGRYRQMGLVNGWRTASSCGD